MGNKKTTILRGDPKEYERIKKCINNDVSEDVEDLLYEIGHLKEMNYIANQLIESYKKRIEYLESVGR